MKQTARLLYFIAMLTSIVMIAVGIFLVVICLSNHDLVVHIYNNFVIEGGNIPIEYFNRILFYGGIGYICFAVLIDLISLYAFINLNHLKPHFFPHIIVIILGLLILNVVFILSATISLIDIFQKKKK